MTSTSINISQNFEWIRKEYPFNELVEQIVEQEDKYINIIATVKKYAPGGGSVLDFGAGTAVAASLLAQEGFKVSGIDDLGDQMFAGEEKQRKIEEFYDRSKVRFIRSDGNLSISEMISDSETFDLIMCHDVLEHIHDSPKPLLEDMVALLNPGGHLFLSVPNAASLRKRIAILLGRTNYAPFGQYYDWPAPWRGHVREYVVDDLRQVAERNNLKIRELRGCDHMTQKLPLGTKVIYSLLTKAIGGLKDCVMVVGQKS